MNKSDSNKSPIDAENHEKTVLVSRTTQFSGSAKADLASSKEKTVANDETVVVARNTTSADPDRTLVLPPETLTKDPNLTVALPNNGRVDESNFAGFKLGDTIKGRFVLKEHLGAGGMGSVYKALDLIQEEAQDKNPWVAIKLLDNIEMDGQDALIFLQRETSKARSLSHPNIITVYDVDRDANVVFMTMECLDGISLEQWIEQNSPASLEKCLPIWEAAASALEYAHQKGLVHCDFKPGNVVISKTNEIKVIDFGIARAKADAFSGKTMLDLNAMGAMTRAYASCEMIEGQAPEPTDDIYALAIVMYKMLTGKHPYPGKTATQARAMKMSPPPIKNLKKSVWLQLSAGLSYDRASRPQHALGILKGLIKEKSVFDVRLVGAGVVALLAVSGFLGLQLSQQKDQQVPLAPQNTVIPVQRQEPVLPPAEAEELEVKLSTGEAHLLMGFYILPPTNNAYDAFKSVLALYPNNERAAAGIKEIADHFAAEGKRYGANRQSEQALNAIQQGLKIMPDHAELLSLREEYFQ
ncbi:MAG: serine/threonine protein kinase [Oceanicoccus sp.]|jgi:serine/threonine protein kinase